MRNEKENIQEASKHYWNIQISPKDHLLTLDWKEMWRYRDMYWLFVMRSFKTAYKQTILGPLWFLITPVLSVIVYVAVFGGIANIPTDGVPPALFYLLGISVWGYFASCLSSTGNSFVSNADIFGKVYFPRLIMPLVAVTVNVLSFLIQLAIFFAFYIYYRIYPMEGMALQMHWHVILFPILMFILAMMAVGFGMIVSSMTTKYRDLQIAFAKIISLWVYITPVIYPLSMVTNPKLHLAMSLNPVTPIIEAIKYSLLGVGQFSWLWLGYSVLMTAILLIIGLMLFNKVQKSFMDTV
ncbi:MAG: ABC transporter permease [Paludibacteraceae bacterium]|nr:ABC transporter permease [Paludibacteraceae bacterium]